MFVESGRTQRNLKITKRDDYLGKRLDGKRVCRTGIQSKGRKCLGI